jgi:membrane-bound lytic murein transglycosylase B
MGSRARSGRNGTLGSTVAIATLLLVSALAALAVLGRPVLPELESGRVPAVAYDAYRSAAELAPAVASGCEVDWTVLAGIAQVESRHGRMEEVHQVTPNGDVIPPIRGAPLDGTNGTQEVPDTDGGELDGDATWDRAMGPLQFIPTTWQELARDGNADGAIDPDNLYDAALTAVAHLCVRSPGDYSDRAALRRALVEYNPSGRYAEEVLSWVERYRTEPLADVVESPGADPQRSPDPGSA